MKSVFLDANVLYVIAGDPDCRLFAAVMAGKARFLASPYVVEEARRNLDPADRANLNRLRAKLRLVPDCFGPPPAGIELPGKDVPVLASAAMARADLLVTLDHDHFGRLYGRTIGGVKVITPRELAVIASGLAGI